MAIQMRRGPYSSFNAANMVSGEFAFITAGDPNTDTGKAIYACFETGTAVRFGTYAEVIAYIQAQGYATGDVIAQYASTAQAAAETATTAAESVSSSAAQIQTNATNIATLQSYKSGEQIDVRWGCYAGYLASAGKGLYFSIPLQKPVASGLTIDFSHFMAVMRHSDGGYIRTATPEALSAYGTVDYYLSTTSIFVRVTMSTASSYTNLAPIVVYANIDSYLSLS